MRRRGCFRAHALAVPHACSGHDLVRPIRLAQSLTYCLRVIFLERQFSTGTRAAVTLYRPTWQDAVVALDSGATSLRPRTQGITRKASPMKSTLSRDIQTRGLVLILLVILLYGLSAVLVGVERRFLRYRPAGSG